MTDYPRFFLCLAVMGGVTYLVRALPLLLIRKKITNVFILSFLSYIPYAVLAAMTFPACFYATGSVWTALAAVIAALIISYVRPNLTLVAAGASLTAFVTHLAITWLPLLFGGT